MLSEEILQQPTFMSQNTLTHTQEERRGSEVRREKDKIRKYEGEKSKICWNDALYL